MPSNTLSVAGAKECNENKNNMPVKYVQTTIDRYFVSVKSTPGASTAANSAMHGWK